MRHPKVLMRWNLRGDAEHESAAARPAGPGPAGIKRSVG